MLYDFYARGFDSTNANRAGFCIHGITAFVPATYKNPMGLAQVFASNYGMNFGMQKNFFF
jgi:hypothetical protein